MCTPTFPCVHGSFIHSSHQQVQHPFRTMTPTAPSLCGLCDAPMRCKMIKQSQEAGERTHVCMLYFHFHRILEKTEHSP